MAVVSSGTAQRAPYPHPYQSYLPVTLLFVDTSYQRSKSIHHLQRMRRNSTDPERRKSFDPRLAGILTVSKRRDGRYAIIDGQHRWYLAQEDGIANLRCDVYEGLTVAQEAELFLALDGAKPLQAAEKFDALCVAGDEASTAIEEIVRRNGCTLNKTSRAKVIRNFSAVKTLAEVYQNYGADVFDTTLRIICAAWPTDREAYTEPFLRGIARFVAAYGDQYSEKALIEKLQRIPAVQVLQKAAAKHVPNMGGSRFTAMSDALLELYNYGRRTHRISVVLHDAS